VTYTNKKIGRQCTKPFSNMKKSERKTLGTQIGKDRSVDRVYPSQDGSCGH